MYLLRHHGRRSRIGSLWLVFIYLGAIGSLHLVWDVADTLNGLMAIPNLISVLICLPLIRRLAREFFATIPARSRK